MLVLPFGVRCPAFVSARTRIFYPCGPLDSFKIRSAARNFALLLRGLARTSMGDGLIAFFDISLRRGACPHMQRSTEGGQMQPVDSCRKRSLTMRSSSEW